MKKDVIYDKETGIITEIPGLSYNSNIHKFTFKSREKKDSTLKNLTRIKRKNKNTKHSKNEKNTKNDKKKLKASSAELKIEKIDLE